jgi:glucose dehydrogenase
LFAGDNASSLVALDAATGALLWHAGLHTAMTNGPITYQLDGVQYVVAGAGDSLCAFAMPAPR